MKITTEFNLGQQVYILNRDNLYDPIIKVEVRSISIDRTSISYHVYTRYGDYERDTDEIFTTFEEAKKALIEQISELEESKYA